MEKRKKKKKERKTLLVLAMVVGKFIVDMWESRVRSRDIWETPE